ncbi:hypothetical protein ORJ00_10550 [Rheinheimera baltica]|uniref:hypothetical protein n=1 Tax=Rheinheimera baltica TaxID=67576 RepID=UPI0004031DC6|nr:hypothetical protein [Rheinheimera baltica]MDP5143185.1 hypothetical protein [Rheinheimera baltica]MDP5149896.1 hypothetical protein [Rheinheimera baltica]
MLTLDKLDQAEQLLAALKQSIAAEDFTASAQQLNCLNEQITQLFIAPTDLAPINYPRLQALSTDFAKLIDTLSAQRYQIKDSISQLRGVKSDNKITRTYKIEKDK